MGDAMIGLIEELRSLVGNERGFIHKKLLGIGKTLVKAVVPGAAAITEAVGTVRGFLGPTTITTARPTPSRFRTARITPTSISQRQRGAAFKLGSELGIIGQPGGGFQPGFFPGGGAGPCDPGLVWNAELGTCVAVGSPVGAQFAGGQAVMGRYGAGMVAGSRIVDRAVCLRGMQLGNDGLCYDKRNITNKQRMWPAGRKPLLTGGQMNAISIAARAAKRLEVTTKRLQRMGMMKKPATRRALPRGHVARLEHASDH